MELSKEKKEIVIEILHLADGEDMDEIVSITGFEEYLLHSLFMRASDDEINYYLGERKNLFKNSNNLL